jgi:hypothetical protein
MTGLIHLQFRNFGHFLLPVIEMGRALCGLGARPFLHPLCGSERNGDDT